MKNLRRMNRGVNLRGIKFCKQLPNYKHLNTELRAPQRIKNATRKKEGSLGAWYSGFTWSKMFETIVFDVEKKVPRQSTSYAGSIECLIWRLMVHKSIRSHVLRAFRIQSSGSSMISIH